MWTSPDRQWDDELHVGGKAVSDSHPLMDLTARTVKQNHIMVGGMKVRYAYLCQKGYYPSRPDWQCQDQCHVIEKFDKNTDKLFMGVFDGHGRVGEGDLASKRTKEILPLKLLEFFKYRASGKSAFVSAFESTNQQIIRELGKKANEAGTSALVGILSDNELSIANCGDSRALLGRRVQSRTGEVFLQAVPLTNDHKPFRADEVQRIKQGFPNSEILTWGMREGETPISEDFGAPDDPQAMQDPPRVWLKGKGYPGCVYTRSIGDAIAKQAGVCATPEYFCQELTDDDSCIVVCSDGVTEFLSNHDIMNICNEHDDPLDACEEIIQTSFRLYLDDDGRTDDITALVVFLD